MNIDFSNWLDVFNLIVFIFNVAVGSVGLFLVSSTEFLMWCKSFNQKFAIWWIHAGITIGLIGLLAQAYRNGMYLFTGVSFTDNQLPLWALKDAGYWLCLFGVVIILAKKNKNKNKNNKN